MDNIAILVIIALLFSKHAIVDFPMQTPFMYRNKGTYGHMGGIVHAGLHGLATIAVLVFFVPIEIALILGFVDSYVHYHVDWAKVAINKRMGWGANTHEQFWWLLGLDQYLHAITYISIVWVLL